MFILKQFISISHFPYFINGGYVASTDFLPLLQDHKTAQTFSFSISLQSSRYCLGSTAALSHSGSWSGAAAWSSLRHQHSLPAAPSAVPTSSFPSLAVSSTHSGILQPLHAPASWFTRAAPSPCFLSSEVFPSLSLEQCSLWFTTHRSSRSLIPAIRAFFRHSLWNTAASSRLRFIISLAWAHQHPWTRRYNPWV